MSTTEKFEDYEVQKRADGSLFELGRGAMGITYKALDTDLQCLVALKIINPSTIANTDAEQRFLREARSAAQLRHPNIAAVYRLGKTPDGTHYYAMEFCEGETLQQIVDKTGPIECKRALQFTIQVAKALAVAEEHMLVHRDLKPSNLIVTNRVDEGEVVKVIDFGLAKRTKSEDTMWSSMGTHGFIGTAHFASPEQIEDKDVDTRSDIYSLGSTLWFMLLGRPPFEGSLARIMSQHLTATPDYSRLAGAPENVVALIRRMMEKDANLRPQTARNLLGELRECLAAAERAEVEKKVEPAPIEEPMESSAPPDATAPPPLPAGGSQAGEAGAQQPDPVLAEAPPELPAAWAPSLLDLLRARSVLAPIEALRIGESLASIIDAEDPAAGPQGALMIQGVTVHFRDEMPESAVRGKLREHVTAWPPFDLLIAPGEAPAAPLEVNPNEMRTIVPGDKFIGDRVQQLAHLLYELLGGSASGRYVPLASLGEGGNSYLQRAIIVGSAAFPQAQDLVNALKTATAGAAGPAPIPHVAPLVAPPPMRPAHVPPATAPSRPPAPPPSPASPSSSVHTPPPLPPLPTSQAPRPAAPVEKLQPAPAPRPAPAPFRGPARRKSSTLESTVVVICVVIGLIISGIGIYAVNQFLKRRRYDTTYHYTPPSDNGATGSGSVAPGDSNGVTPPGPGGVSSGLTSGGGFGQPGPVQFTISDHLGKGQIAETVWIYLDDQNPPVGSIVVNVQQPTGSFVVTSPTAGHHIISAQTQTITIDRKRGVRTLTGTGRWDADLHGGEQYDIQCAPFGTSDTYELQLVGRP